MKHFKGTRTIVCAVALCVGLTAWARGNEGSGGGGGFASEFASYGYQAGRVIKNKPNFPVSSELFNNTVLTTQVEFVEEELRDQNGLRVDALNFPEKRLIKVHVSRWMQLSLTPVQKFQLAVHEYLGILKVDDTGYQFSSSIIARNYTIPEDLTNFPSLWDIAWRLSDVDYFKTFIAALDTADLYSTLQRDPIVRRDHPSPFFTVFVPVDEAFLKLPSGTLDGLLGDVPALKNLLLYHVVPGGFGPQELVAMKKATGAQGGLLRFSIGENGSLYVNNAKVLGYYGASNGIIYVIDTVLSPRRH